MATSAYGDSASSDARFGARSEFPTGGLRLHLGSGPHAEPGWINVDKSWVAQVSRFPKVVSVLAKAGILNEQQAAVRWPTQIVRMDLTKRFVWDDASVHAIYSSHMIEHLSRDEARRLLAECLRVLAPGGILRLALPNLNAAVKRYLESKEARDPRAADALIDFLYFVPQLEDTSSALHRVGMRLFHRPHRWMYDPESMGAVLEDVGYDRVEPLEFRRGDCPDLKTIETRSDDLFKDDTFYVEAYKA